MVSEKTLNILDFGADPSGKEVSTQAIQKTLDSVNGEDAYKIVVPQGTFLTGLLHLKSNTEIHLKEGAVLLASPRIEDHTFNDAKGGILLGRDLENISITGTGEIQGNEDTWFIQEESHSNIDYDLSSLRQGTEFFNFPIPYPDGPLKPRERTGNLIVLSNCRHVRFTDFTIRGASSYWTVHLGDCHHIHFENLRIINNPKYPNNDGIHLTSCQHALLKNLEIIAGDDAIALTGFRNIDQPALRLGFQDLDGELKDIRVENCRFISRSSAIRIGCGYNDISDIQIKDLTITDSNRGILIQTPHCGSIRKVALENISIQTRFMAGPWWGNGEPLSINSMAEYDDKNNRGIIEDIVVSNIKMTGPSPVALYAPSKGLIRNVQFKNCQHRLVDDPFHKQRGETVDLRPSHNPKTAFINVQASAFFSHNVENVEIDNQSKFLDLEGNPANEITSSK